MSKYTDFGTPAKTSDNQITLEIDGTQITVPEGTSIMHAAMVGGVTVPKLCATDSLDPYGSCRLCLVEIEGRRGYPASCTTPVAQGIKVKTQTPKLADIRKGVMELYISDHPLDCLTCATNGDCELQDMAGAVGLREVRYGYEGIITLSQKRTLQILISSLIRLNVLSVHAAFVLVKKFREHLL
jgi:formate dehydrogenase major subunit